MIYMKGMEVHSLIKILLARDTSLVPGRKKQYNSSLLLMHLRIAVPKKCISSNTFWLNIVKCVYSPNLKCINLWVGPDELIICVSE